MDTLSSSLKEKPPCKVVLNVPQYLQGQDAGQLFDPGTAGVVRGAGPAGVLGSSLTVPIGLLGQALAMGFSISTYIFG